MHPFHVVEELLDVVIGHVWPDLDTKRREIFQQQHEQKIALTNLETLILDSLAASKGDLLENVDLLSSLEASKDKSLQIQSNIKTLDRLRTDTEKQRNQYRPAARKLDDRSPSFLETLYSRATQMFGALQSSRRLNDFYQFGRSSLFRIFKMALEKSKVKDDARADVHQQAASLNRHFIQVALRHLCELCQRDFCQVFCDHVFLAIFAEDRHCVALHVIRAAYPDLELDGEEWNVMLSCAETGKDAGGSVETSRVPSWVPPSRTKAFRRLVESCAKIVRLCEDFTDTRTWERWMVSSQAAQDMPNAVQLNPLQRLTVIAAVRPEMYGAAS